jgi:hypothetical protein
MAGKPGEKEEEFFIRTEFEKKEKNEGRKA